MMKRVVILYLLSMPAMAWANPIDAFGFGARATAMGGAATAISNDSAANYYNPAGLATGGRLRIDLGMSRVEPKLEIDGTDQAVTLSEAFEGGLILPTKLLGRKLAFSFGIHLPHERISRIKAMPERKRRWVLWDNRPQRLVLTSSVGVQLHQDFYVGGGVTYLASTAGVLQMNGDVYLLEADQTLLRSDVDVNMASVRYGSAGLLYAPKRGFRAGLSWRQDFSLGLDLGVKVHGRVVVDANNVLVPDGRFELQSSATALYSPEQAQLGLGYVAESWLVSVDVGWIRWSAFPAPAARVELLLDLDPLPVDVPVPAVPLEPCFKDIVVPRIGLEWTPGKTGPVAWTIRSGYFYEPSPAPQQLNRSNYVDSDKHAVSAGLGLRIDDRLSILPRPLEVDLAVQWISLVHREYTKADPATHGDDYDARGQSLGLKVGMSLVF